MNAPYGIEITENCAECSHSRPGFFCDWSRPALQALNQVSHKSTLPAGALLFVEGQVPRGVFVICNGLVKLSTSSAGGKSLILRMAAPGEVIGLPGTISGKPYEATAEALEPIQANFIPRKPFLEFLRTHGEVALRVAQALTDIYYAAYREVRCLALTGSVEEKLASFLLDFAAARASDNAQTRVVLTLTHEEIAGMIGATRETVTRLFTDFRRKGLVQLHGSSLVITDKTGLQKLLAA